MTDYSQFETVKFQTEICHVKHCFDVFLSGFLKNCTRCTKFHMESAGLYDLALQFIQKNILLRKFNSLVN